MNQSETIAQMLEQARNFTKFYIGKIDPARSRERYEFAGSTKNSALWIMGHLAWAELQLCNETLAGPPLESFVTAHFAIKSDGASLPDELDFETVYKEMERIHAHVVQHLRSMSDEAWEEETYVAPARWKTIRRKAAFHMIRHESFHTGQLSWIAQEHGAQTP